MNLALKLGACAAVGTATYFAYIFPHTINLDRNRKYITRYRLEKELIVPKRIRKRINAVMEDMKLPEDIRNRINVFEVAGFELSTMGLISTKYGAILGIPPNYSYKDVSDVPHEYIRMFDVPIDWTREEAKAFLETLVIPKRAQKAAMAHTLVRMQTEDVRGRALLTGTWVGGTLGAYQMFKSKVKNRMTFMVALAAGSLVAWLHAMDYLSRSVEQMCDDKMLQLGPEYVVGFKEYLDILAKRCVASRNVMEEYGQTLFKENGDRKYWLLRTQSIPLSKRRDFFSSKILELGIS